MKLCDAIDRCVGCSDHKAGGCYHDIPLGYFVRYASAAERPKVIPITQVEECPIARRVGGEGARE